MYWEGQWDIKMDDKEDEHLDEYVFMVQMVPIDGTFMQHTTYVPMKVKLDEKHLMTGGNAKFIISNPKTLMNTSTH